MGQGPTRDPARSGPEGGAQVVAQGYGPKAADRVQAATGFGERKWAGGLQAVGPALQAHSDASLVYHPGLRRFLLFTGLKVWEYDPEEDAWSRRKKAEVVDETGQMKIRTQANRFYVQQSTVR